MLGDFVTMSFYLVAVQEEKSWSIAWKLLFLDMVYIVFGSVFNTEDFV